MVELIQRLHKPQQSPYSAIALERRAQLLDSDKQKIERCRQWLRDIDREDYYEEGDEDEEIPILTKKAIKERLALMLGAVHIGGPQTPEAFIKMLLEHVYDAEVSYLALLSACRQIEETEKYVPAISELLNLLKEHDQQWGDWKWALHHIERTSNELQGEIREAQARYQRESAERRLEEARGSFNRLCYFAREDKKLISAAQDSPRGLSKSRTAMGSVGAAPETDC
jgi:hypothetical protein